MMFFDAFDQPPPTAEEKRDKDLFSAVSRGTDLVKIRSLLSDGANSGKIQQT